MAIWDEVQEAIERERLESFAAGEARGRAAEQARCASILEEMLAPLAGSEQYEERVGAYFLTEALRRVRGEEHHPPPP